MRVGEDKRPNACTLRPGIVDSVLHQLDLLQSERGYPTEMDFNNPGLGLDHNVSVEST